MDSKVMEKRLKKQQHDFYKRYSVEPHRKHCQWKRYMVAQLARMKSEIAEQMLHFVKALHYAQEDNTLQSKIFHQTMQECRRTRFVHSFRTSMASVIEGIGESSERTMSRGYTLPSLRSLKKDSTVKKDRHSEQPLTREQLMTISSRFSMSGKQRTHELTDEHVRNIISRRIKEQLEDTAHPLNQTIRLFARLFTQRHKHFSRFFQRQEPIFEKNFHVIEEETDEDRPTEGNQLPTSINPPSSQFQDLELTGRPSAHKSTRILGMDEKGVLAALDTDPGLTLQSQEMCRELEEYILFLSNAVVKFYNLVFRLDVLSGLGNEIITYIVQLAITGTSYRVIYGALRLKDITQEQHLRQKMEKLKDIKPSDVGISPLFALDYTSDLLNPIYHSPALNQYEAQARLSEQPYLDAIARLELLNELENPFDKLCVITQLTSEIVRCINNFWKGARLKSSSLLIDADQNISIIVYILIKSQISDLYTQLRMMKRLIPKALRASTKAGYYLATMEGCLQYVRELDVGRYVSGEDGDLVSQIRTFSHKEGGGVQTDNQYFTAVTHEARPETYRDSQAWSPPPLEVQKREPMPFEPEGEGYFFTE